MRTMQDEAVTLKNPEFDPDTGEILQPEVNPMMAAVQPTTARGAGQTGVWAMPKPRTQDELMQMAQQFADSGMVPKQYVGKPGAVLVAWQKGAEIGLQPMQALQNICVINGQPTVWGDGMLAIVQVSGLMERFVEKFTFDSAGGVISATCVVKRKGDDDIVERHFSLQDAVAAGLTKKDGPWQQYRSRMLQMRARSWALRDKFADVLGGIHAREEYMGVTIEGETINAHGDVVEAKLSDQFEVDRKGARVAARQRGESGSANGNGKGPRSKAEQVKDNVKGARAARPTGTGKGQKRKPVTLDAEADSEIKPISDALKDKIEAEEGDAMRGRVADLMAAVDDAGSKAELESMSDDVDATGSAELQAAFVARFQAIE